MYSLYRAHITGGKDFHKRATLQGKQHKKASTLFCGNGQNRALCLPRHCSLDPHPGFRVNVRHGAWSFRQAQSSVRSWPVDPAPPQFCLPSLEEPSHKPQRLQPGTSESLPGRPPHTSQGPRPHAEGICLHQKPGVCGPDLPPKSSIALSCSLLFTRPVSS